MDSLKKIRGRYCVLMHDAYTDAEWCGDETVFRWHKEFSKSRENVSLLAHIGHSASVCMEEMVNMITVTVRDDAS